ncbi:MAG: hypothetical protein ACE5JI_16575 [Acidobacteriota bacterium]
MSTELSDPPEDKADPDEPPPVLGSWRRFYLVVILNTVFVYLLLYLFSHYTAR